MQALSPRELTASDAQLAGLAVAFEAIRRAVSGLRRASSSPLAGVPPSRLVVNRGAGYANAFASDRLALAVAHLVHALALSWVRWSGERAARRLELARRWVLELRRCRAALLELPAAPRAGLRVRGLVDVRRWMGAGEIFAGGCR